MFRTRVLAIDDVGKDLNNPSLAEMQRMLNYAKISHSFVAWHLGHDHLSNTRRCWRIEWTVNPMARNNDGTRI